MEHIPVVKCLNFHAAYLCRRSGACCRAGWPIPFTGGEAAEIRHLRLSRGSLVQAQTGETLAVRLPDGTCTFFETESGLCGIHRAGGQRALPLACRMFPRVVLHDARGTFVSLSHFCPTAVSLLFEASDDPVAIVDAPTTLIDVGPLDGLDARNEWPPLLRPGMLMDPDSYDLWERRGIELLMRDGIAARTAVVGLHEATRRLATWTPDRGPLAEAVRREMGSDPTPSLIAAPVSEAIAVKRWLAARLFGCWIAYQGHGLLAIVDYLHRCLDLVEAERARGGGAREAIRRSDFQLMHTP